MTHHELHLFVDSQYASPYAMSAYVALREKGLPFDITTVDLAANAQHEAGFAVLSLTQRVPTLVHNGFSLSESSAIAEYIDEVFPGMPLYPADVQSRARARQVQAWLRSDLMPIRQERSTEVIFYRPTATPLSAAAKTAADKLFFIADSLLSAHTENLFDEWCIADVDLTIMLNRLLLNGDPVPEKLANYATRQWLRPTVQQWVNQQRPPL
ncbi:glutathione transferase [Leeia oryzae]|uniref:glutathione transferase n=1 Tax=Leeia oryzae TaxID=356662 RepID=UPI00037948A1|nr:glutathione transferase [Leeia oryzae]